MYNPETEGQVVREAHRVEARKIVQATASYMDEMRSLSSYIKATLAQIAFTSEKPLKEWQRVAINSVRDMVISQEGSLKGATEELTKAQQLLKDKGDKE